MKNYSVLALALCFAPSLAVPPESFGFPTSEDDTPLSVQFGQQVVVPGILFGSDVPAQQPSIAVNESYSSLDYEYTGEYIAFMVDPDASTPENPTSRFIIHYWQEGLTKSTTEVNSTAIGGTLLVNTTAPRGMYRRPRPPPTSAAHRYILYLFEQPANYQVPEQYSGFGGMNVSRFPFVQFVDDANLGTPVAANYFYCSNQTIVPGTFVAAPGSQYPGGNGAMVTQGTNNPTPTSASASATSSGTAVSSLPPQGAAAARTGNAALAVLVAAGAALALC